MVQYGKIKKSKDGDGSRIATLTGGLSIEIGLSEVDAMTGQGPSTGRVGTPLKSGTPLGLELLPREELSARGNLPQRRKYYPGQSAKTLLYTLLRFEFSGST